jgi:precorrin-2 dehydrogenase/sirohydrochlorin ferrochelatase
MTDEDRTPYYPIFLNIHGKPCLVIGGGQVALRKVRALLEHGADVKLISPDICPELSTLVENRAISAIRKSYQAGDLHGAFIVIAATDNSNINSEIVKECHSLGVLVNVVDNAEESDFILPSSLRRGSLTVAIATSGKSPALSRKIRTLLERDFDKEYAKLVLLIEEVRSEIKKQGIKVDEDDWQKALELDLLLELIKKRDEEKAKTILFDNLRALSK